MYRRTNPRAFYTTNFEPNAQNCTDSNCGIHRLQLLLKSALVIAVFIASGTCFGALRQRLVQTVSPRPLGSAVKLYATVLRTKPLSDGQQIVLEVNRISPVANSSFTRVHFQAEWMNWHSAKDPNKKAQLHKAAQVLLTGVLKDPPLKSSSGLPVRAVLKQMGIHYEFEGRVIQTISATTGARQTVLTYISHTLSRLGNISQRDKGLLLSVVFGDTTQSLPAQTKQWFLRAGLLHVLAASGANVFIMEWFFHIISWPVRQQRIFHVNSRVLMLLSVAFVWLFAWLCGLDASIVRAALMSSYRSFGMAAGRVPSSWNGLWLAGVVMTAVNPELLLTPSSVLSFTATAAVQTAMNSVYSGSNLSAKRRRLKHRGLIIRVSLPMLLHVLEIVKASIFVEIFLLPLLLYWFHQLTPFAVLSNLLAEPLVALLLPLTAFLMLGAAIAQLPGGAALYLVVHVLSDIVIRALHLLIFETQFVGSFPEALYTTDPLSFVDILSYYIVVFGMMYLAKKISQYTNM